MHKTKRGENAFSKITKLLISTGLKTSLNLRLFKGRFVL